MVPKISVMMGIFNTPKKFIKTAIDSILNQTYQNFELIICNDGCTDDTFEYIKKEYGEIKKVKLVENEQNKGLAYTLNHCLKVAEGEYIARMDGDDISLPTRFEKQVKVLEENKEIGLVNCNIDIFDQNGIFNERIFNEYISKKDFLFSSPIIHPAVMFRKSEIEKVNGYTDKKYTYRIEDYDLFMKMMANGTKMYTLQEKVFQFREDKNTYKRRKYRYRFNEFIVRVIGFYRLKLYPIGFIYAIKPFIVGLIPTSLMIRLKKGGKG